MLLQSTVSDCLEEAFLALLPPGLTHSYPCALMHVNSQTHMGSQAFSLTEMTWSPARQCVTKANEDLHNLKFPKEIETRRNMTFFSSLLVITHIRGRERVSIVPAMKQRHIL